VPVRATAAELGIGHSAVQEMVESLGYWKIGARWVPRLLTEDHKLQHKNTSSQHLERYRTEGDFLLSTVAGDESWFYQFEAETKRQSMEWRHPTSLTKKKPKTVPSASKIMGTVFSDLEGCILIEFLLPGETINAAHYVETLKKLRHALRGKRSGGNIILQHDNAWPHTACLTLEEIQRFRSEVLPYPPYSPDLALSDYHLFGLVKDQMRRHRHDSNEEIKQAVHQCIQAAGTEFFWKGIFKLPEQWEKCVERNESFVEN
jgi:histone-lysine N-methyltransferase SETMAR